MAGLQWRFPVPGHDELVAYGALVAGICGALAVVPVPTELRGLPMLVFFLAGPGSAVMCWLQFPPAVTMAAVVGISIASTMALAVAMAWLEFWHPFASCLILAALVFVSGLLRLRSAAKPVEGATSW